MPEGICPAVQDQKVRVNEGSRRRRRRQSVTPSPTTHTHNTHKRQDLTKQTPHLGRVPGLPFPAGLVRLPLRLTHRHELLGVGALGGPGPCWCRPQVHGCLGGKERKEGIFSFRGGALLRKGGHTSPHTRHGKQAEQLSGPLLLPSPHTHTHTAPSSPSPIPTCVPQQKLEPLHVPLRVLVRLRRRVPDLAQRRRRRADVEVARLRKSGGRVVVCWCVVGVGSGR